jgi:pyruvate dehydrogenase E2 component (dihydrolipoamide acetyltransferase)
MRDLGMDPAQIRGSGPNGRIVSADLAARSSSASATRRPLTSMRRTIARRLMLSKQSIPHFYLRQTLNAQPLASFYAESKARFPCSINDIVIGAVALAVSEFPAFRSRLDGDDLIELQNVHLGIAVGIPDGLVVPTVLDADKLNIRELAAETKRIAGLARLRKIENGGESVFSVTNLGMFGVEEFTAIVNPPESGILAVGAIRETPIAKDGVLFAGKALTLNLSCDHRIVDGMVAAQFMGKLKAILESPKSHLSNDRE